MTEDEALDLALKTLRSVAGELYRVTSYCDTYDALAETNNAIMDIQQARSAPVQDSTCNETLRAQGKAYPRTCRKCGFGPCIGAPKQPPAAPVQQKPLFADIIARHPGLAEELKAMDAAPVQEPVAWMYEDMMGLVGVRVQKEKPIVARPVTPLCLCTPPAAQRQWVGLDDDDISALGLSISKARALESLLKRRNT
jgi:hypothetical protein